MARIRSPNFPGIPLEDAVNFVSAIFEKNRQAVIMREDAAKDIGYSGLTGRSLKVLGALNQYDLIENVSKGQLKVTDTACDILHGYPEEARIAALHRAGNAPSLFASIYERFEGDVPGENAVRSFLVQKGFTNQGVEKALKSFLNTNRYLEIKGVAKSHRNDGEDGADSLSATGREEGNPMQQDASQRQDGRKGCADVAALSPWLNKGPLDINFNMKSVHVSGQTSDPDELQEFIDDLLTLKGLLEKRVERTEH